MPINERNIFGDLPSRGQRGQFHSAVLTSYALDLIHFDSKMVSLLHRKQISSINVLADQEQLNKSIKFVDCTTLSGAGSEYALSGVKADGAFHPKINFFAGDESALVSIGTGNLTVTGHGKNHELFSGFYVNKKDQSQLPLIRETWKYLTDTASSMGEYTKSRVCGEIPANCSLLQGAADMEPHSYCNLGGHTSAALLYSDGMSGILSQLVFAVPMDEVREITVVSPFFDEDGATLIALAEQCPKAEVRVLIQSDCSLPPCKIKQHPRIKFYDFDRTVRGRMGLDGFSRKLHAKFYCLQAKKNTYCLIGSANATVAGMGTLRKEGINKEFCILYKMPHRDILEELGLQPEAHLEKEVNTIKREQPSASAADALPKFHLCSADYIDGSVRLQLTSNNKKKAVRACLDEPSGKLMIPVVVDGDRAILSHKLERGVCTVYLADESGSPLSNTAFVNRLDDLELTSPSEENRKINLIVAKFENTGSLDMDVPKILSELLQETSPQILHKLSKGHVQKKKTDAPLQEQEYDAEFDESEEWSGRSHVSHGTSRLLDCIDQTLLLRCQAIDDELKGEEDEGDATTSNVRSAALSAMRLVTSKQIRDVSADVSWMLHHFTKYLEKRQRFITEKKESLSCEDFNCFSLALWAAIEICYLNQIQYVLSDASTGQPIDDPATMQELNEDLNDTMRKNGVDALVGFVLFCMKNPLPEKTSPRMRVAIERAKRYAVLFATLFNRKSDTDDVMGVGWRVDLCLLNLCDLFGNFEAETISQSVEPLCANFDGSIRLEWVHEMMAQVVANKSNEAQFPYFKGSGFCYRKNRKVVNVLK